MTNDLVLQKITPAIVFAPGGVEAIIGKVENETRAQAAGLDISRPKDRAAMRSLAAKVASSKTLLDDMGKTLSDEWRKKAEAIHAERRTIRDRLDALKDEVRKPLTDYEEAEKLRIDGHEQEILALQAMAVFSAAEPSAADVKRRMDAFDGRPARDWQEFVVRASAMADAVGRQLQDILDTAVRREAERAELARLRREQAEREQRERDERIAREAAERARIDAETKARAEQERIEREARQAAEQAAAEQRRVEQEKADAERRAAAAEQARLAASAKAEADAKAAADAAERAKVAAVEAERQRIVDHQAFEAEQSRRREADKAHRAKINGEAKAALIAAGLSEAAAKSAVTAIASGQVPHTKIVY